MQYIFFNINELNAFKLDLASILEELEIQNTLITKN